MKPGALVLALSLGTAAFGFILPLACRPAPREAPAPHASAAAIAPATTTAVITSTTDVGDDTSDPPAPLRCVARYYVGEPLRAKDAWWLKLPDGTRVAYDDTTKSLAERIESPDVVDLFEQRYRAGPIVSVDGKEDDPGRTRVEPLFDSTYGRTAEEVVHALVPVRLRGQWVRVHPKVAEALRRVSARLDHAVRADRSVDRFFINLGGTFVWRNIAGTKARSTHSWGIAIDLNPALSDYWRNRPLPPVWRNRMPAAIVEAFESEGFIWGGRWHHYDTMHFEFRPELLDASCYP